MSTLPLVPPILHTLEVTSNIVISYNSNLNCVNAYDLYSDGETTYLSSEDVDKLIQELQELKEQIK